MMENRQIACSPVLPSRPACRLCESADASIFLPSSAGSYWQCERCDVVFIDATGLPDPEREHAHYRLHQNDPQDPRYRAFLARLGAPLLERLAPCSAGLDYGCGPGPGLAAMFREAGHAVSLYDPFFATDPAPLAGKYDFIICCEVAEHFHDPGLEFKRLRGLLRPGGWLGIMTCFRQSDHSFESWRYRKDPTHVAFYSEKTFRWIASNLRLELTLPRKDVALLQKLTDGETQ